MSRTRPNISQFEPGSEGQIPQSNASTVQWVNHIADTLTDFDGTGATNNSIIRYDSTASSYVLSNDTYLDSSGKFMLETSGDTGGILFGGNVHLYHVATNIITLAAGDIIRASTVPSAANDLVNKNYVDSTSVNTAKRFAFFIF